jgi:hypothetical protein
VLSTALLLFFCALAPLAGCGQSGPQQALDTYVARLENTFDTAASVPPVAATPRPPKTSELRLDLPSAKLGTLDFLALTGCEIQITIGKRNSSLGRLAGDSQRLLLELEFLQHAPECIIYMRKENKSDLADILEQAFDLKREQLPVLIFNATLANREYRDFWARPGEVGDYPAQTSSAVLSALAAINLNTERWLAGDYRADNRDFEILLSEVARGDGGTLLLALAVQKAYLDAANKVLHESLADGPICTAQFRSAAADILPRVVQKYFIAGVQPWSASLGRRYHELIPAFSLLEKQLEAALPEPYLVWKQERQQIFARLTAAPAEHVALLQRVLKPCEGG